MGVPVDPCGEFLRLLHARIGGLWPMSNPPPVVAKVMARHEFASWQHDFVVDLKAAVPLLLDGLMVFQTRALRGGL